MSVQFSVDSREFQETMRKYLAVSSRTLPEALNQKMFFIVRNASTETEKNEKSKIESELSVSGYELRYTKKGLRALAGEAVKGNGPLIRKGTQQGRGSAAMFGGPLVYKIINARRRFAGKPGLKRWEMKEKAGKLLAARLRSVGTLKAGWWGALTILRKATGSEGFAKLSETRIKHPSVATPAQPGFSPKVSMEYRLLAKDPHYQRSIDKRVIRALNKAWAHELASMKEYIEKKLRGAFKKVAPETKPGVNLSSVMRNAMTGKNLK